MPREEILQQERIAPSAAVVTEAEEASVNVRRPVGTILVLLLSDIAALMLSMLIASALRLWITGSPGNSMAFTMAPALVITLAIFGITGLYPGVCINPVEELRSSCLAVTVAFLSLLSGTLFLHDVSRSRFVYATGFLFAITLVPVFRAVARRAFCRMPWWGSEVAILGYCDSGRLLLKTLLNNPEIGLRPVAVLDDEPKRYLDLGPDIVRGPLSRCLKITRDHQISYGIVCMPSASREELLDIIERYGPSFTHLLVIPNLIGMSSLGICAREVGGIVGLEVRHRLLTPFSRVVKRIIDLAIVIAVAPLGVALVLLGIAAVKLQDGGPAFYASERVGRRGRPFKIWKLRSMVLNGDEVLTKYLKQHPAEEELWLRTQKIKDDPRITRVGRFLRKTSIDELPQLWNVFTGKMSLVGPRPVLPQQVELYGPSFSLYKQVRPGITGLWQVSGRNELDFNERVRLDKYVIQNWSIWLDIYLLVRTIGVLLTARGAY